MAEKQEHMRERVKNRPCQDGRSRKARRVRARLIKLEEVVPHSPEYVGKRSAARFMSSRNFPPSYIANQLGLSLTELEEMLAEAMENSPVSSGPAFGPSEGARNLLRQQEREKRRAEKLPRGVRALRNPDAEFVTAFAGEVPALTKDEEDARRAELAEVRQRESRDAGERKPGCLTKPR